MRSATELWPGQAAQDAAREAARAQGAPPPGGYRPSAYMDEYLAGASLEPFVHPLSRPSGPLFVEREHPGAHGGQGGSGALDLSTVRSAADGPRSGGGDDGSSGADGTHGSEATADHDLAEDEGLAPDGLAGGDQPRGRRGRTAAAVGGVLAVVAAGAGGAFAFGALGGGGPQPESALPSTTVAFVKVDLDPSAGQKVDAIRFLRAFPQAREKVTEKSDLREVAFTALQDEGQLKGVDYAREVAPWLGQRLALGLVPAPVAKTEPTVVVALAVTDPAAARAHLPALATAMGGACRVVEDFAVCTRGKDGTNLDAVVTATARGSLADAATFRQDMGALGEDGIVAGWVDSAKAAETARGLGLLSGPALGGAVLTGVTGLPSAAEAPYAEAGRTAVALRFDGPHLELAGHTTGAKASFVGTKHVTGVTSLPWDSLAAVSVANGGDQLRAAWPDIEKVLTGMGAGSAADDRLAKDPLAKDPLAALEDQFGLSLPDDLCAALGSQFTVVFGGVEKRNGELRAAVVGDGDQVVLGKLAKSGQAFGGEALTLLPAPGRSVLATSDEYGQEVVKGSGLGGMPSFEDAVKDVEDARVVGYVDIAGLVSQFADELDEKDRADLANLSALGLTISGEGHDADFRLRLTTK